jgi:hypothetical protein
MDLLKEIGAILGFVAFGGMAVLAFLTFQQARHLRRLRDWAGRSPERAAVEAERVAGAASEATIARRGGLREEEEDEDRAPEEPGETGPGRVHRLRGEAAYRWEVLDQRSPVDPKLLLVGLLAVLIGVGILTSGFGLLGGSDESSTPTRSSGSGGSSGGSESKPPKVAVLNGTATEVGGVGVEGVAQTAGGFVQDAGFRVDEETNGPPLDASVVMFTGDAKSDAKDLAGALEEQLGPLEVVEMTPEVEELAGKADIALVVGADDAGI